MVVACSLLSLLASATTKPISAPRDNAYWRLTDDARRAFIEFYSPIIFKRADETGNNIGHDWVTNFYYDGDNDFSNNKKNWHKYLDNFIDDATRGPYRHWSIRPTLYTAVLEFMEDGEKQLVLLYHIYHAKQQGSIHDWERVEIRIRSVKRANPYPGGGESIQYVVITEHSKHERRLYGNPDLNFHQTARGKHPLIFQAEWSNDWSELRKAELRFVQEPWKNIKRFMEKDQEAQVNISGEGATDFHYVFVPKSDVAAVEFWNAKQLANAEADKLYAGVGSTTNMAASKVKRIQYEFQDLADILPTHVKTKGPNWSWHDVTRDIFLSEPLYDESGAVVEIPRGIHTFLGRALDDEDPDEDRRGYPLKSWFWGTYNFGAKGHWTGRAYKEGYPDGKRCTGNGFTDCEASFFYQHDYFMHNGQIFSGGNQQGKWLDKGWHTAKKGGFDGRWRQLFED